MPISDKISGVGRPEAGNPRIFRVPCSMNSTADMIRSTLKPRGAHVVVRLLNDILEPSDVNLKTTSTLPAHHISRYPKSSVARRPNGFAGLYQQNRHIAEIPRCMSDLSFRALTGHQNRGSRLPLVTLNGLQIPVAKRGSPIRSMLEAACFTPKADHVSDKYRHTEGRYRETAANRSTSLFARGASGIRTVSRRFDTA